MPRLMSLSGVKRTWPESGLKIARADKTQEASYILLRKSESMRAPPLHLHSSARTSSSGYGDVV